MDMTANTGVTGGGTPMGSNGKTVNGDTPNVAGPAMAKPESKGPLATSRPALTPKSVA